MKALPAKSARYGTVTVSSSVEFARTTTNVKSVCDIQLGPARSPILWLNASLEILYPLNTLFTLTPWSKKLPETVLAT